ncbi:MAG: HD domain-containing protein [Acidobacteria bacterium]|nr:HD domain-containing protein [Acidobacteriota bacterium]
MSEEARRILAAEDFLRRFAASVKAIQLYSGDHPIVRRAHEQFAEHLERMLVEAPQVVVGLVDRQVVVDAVPVTVGSGTAETVERFRSNGIERIAFARGVTRDELNTFSGKLAALRAARDDSEESLQALASSHIQLGRLRIQQRVESGHGGVTAIQETYRDAVASAEALWEQTKAEGSPEPEMAMAVVEGLASGVGQNRRAMLALTAMCRYDNYTFTHMVNVSVLTMAQARGLGVDGALLRQFGLAGLMHDIGKIKTPPEILTKPEQLSGQEFVVMMRHPTDGAEMLRRHLELPPLAAIVAFEHHLRIDGTGYPAGVVRPALNVATQLCSIADVYDAMRSQRRYQQSFPTERILKVLEQQDGTRFDQHLVRRFSQLMGLYPPGNLVRLDSGALAVVLRTHAPDPARPTVRVVVSPDGRRLSHPVDLALWADAGPSGPPPRIVTPVDPQEAGIDPFAFLDAHAA